MRFPKLTELDADQLQIYSGAPPTGSIVVIGPPGTGKTVMAFHRAAYLEARGRRKADKALVPQVIMYSKVLSTYTALRDGVGQHVSSSTMHKWVYAWWRGMFGKARIPLCGDDPYTFDWTAIAAKVLRASDQVDGRQHWGHLIIDEGQDFPSDMYRVLAIISTASPTRDGDSSPAITVFADDNQRLAEGKNSTIAEIDAALALPEGRKFTLRKNYRNTAQIAEFARHFYVGLSSGVPELPSRVGSTSPKVVFAKSGIEVVRRRIANFAANNPDKDVGVICMSDALRKKCFNSIESRLMKTRVVVQTYSSRERDKHPPEQLVFDRGGSVTVLNAQSAKGLEFDAVFVVDPLQDMGGASVQQARMQLYVTASRPRDYLELVLINPPENFRDLLPDPKTYDFIEE